MFVSKCSRYGRRTCSSLPAASKILIFFGLLQTVIVIVVCASDLTGNSLCIPTEQQHNSRISPCSPEFTVNQAIALLIGMTFWLFSIIDGTFNYNIYEVYGAVFQGAFILAWAIFRFVSPYPNTTVDFTLLIISCVSQVIYFGLTWPLHKVYSWRTYRKAGADADFRGMYETYLIWVTFSKLETSFGIINALLSGKGIYNIMGSSSAQNWAMAIFLGIFSILGLICINREMKYFTPAWLVLFIVPAGFLGINIWQAIWTIFFEQNSTSFGYLVLANFVLITGVVGMVVHVAFFVLSVKMYQNFGKGLLELQYFGEAFRETVADEGSSDEDPTITDDFIQQSPPGSDRKIRAFA